jgi:hypothetical protein
MAYSEDEEDRVEKKTWTPRRILLAVLAVALFLRLWAALQLPVDFDEPVYMEAAEGYAEAIRAGDWNAVIDYPGNREHPPLVKIIYGLAILALGDAAGWTVSLFAARAISAVLGVLAVLLVARLNLVAGAMLAVHTLVVKYTGQAYLESWPHLMSIAAVLAFFRYSQAPEKDESAGDSPIIGDFPLAWLLPRSRWFWVSALALGLTAAGKYTYLPVVVVILYLALKKKGFPWSSLLPYALTAALTFWAFNPTLWRDPLPRFLESLLFHTQYSQTAHVAASGYAWYQPLIWIAHSASFQWHPDVFFYFGFDGLIFLLTLGGLVFAWREQRWLVVWFGACLIFLLLWPTKWPQYTMVMIPAMCLIGADTAGRLYKIVADFESYYGTLSELFPRPPRYFWIMSGLVMGTLFVAYVVNTVNVALGQLGWSQITPSNSFLPSRAVNDIVVLPGGQMVLATDSGVAFWSPPEATDLPDTWVIFTTRNSDLPHNRVLAVEQDLQGRLWFGTQAGLARYEGERWIVYRANDIGLAGEQVNDLAYGADGRLWAATHSGAAVYDGKTWQTYTSQTSGLVNDAVFSLAVNSLPPGDQIWFGTLDGLSRLDTASGEWINFSASDLGFGAGGVSDVMVDNSGQVWVATLGGGLGVWDGESWFFYRTSNSGIPYNTVQYVIEVEPGLYWVGVGIPNSTGGVVVSYDGLNWRRYTTSNSGYSGSEPQVFVVDESNRIWIGTRTSGIDVYQYRR